MTRAARLLLGLALALLGSWALPGTAQASEGTLSVHPGTVRPGGSVRVCGAGFSFAGDRVVSTGVDGLVGPHTEVRSDGTACLVLRYADFRAPYDRYVPLFLAAQGADGTFRTDTGRVFVSSGRLPRTGAPVHLVAEVGGSAVVAGMLVLYAGRRRSLGHRGTAS